MKRFLIFFVASLLLDQTTFLYASEIMPLSQVKEGMIGVGRTVFKGNKIE